MYVMRTLRAKVCHKGTAISAKQDTEDVHLFKHSAILARKIMRAAKNAIRCEHPLSITTGGSPATPLKEDGILVGNATTAASACYKRTKGPTLSIIPIAYPTIRGPAPTLLPTEDGQPEEIFDHWGTMPTPTASTNLDNNSSCDTTGKQDGNGTVVVPEERRSKTGSAFNEWLENEKRPDRCHRHRGRCNVTRQPHKFCSIAPWNGYNFEDLSDSGEILDDTPNKAVQREECNMEHTHSGTSVSVDRLHAMVARELLENYLVTTPSLTSMRIGASIGHLSLHPRSYVCERLDRIGALCAALSGAY